MEIVGRSGSGADRVVWIDDLSVRSLIRLIDRLEQSQGMEQFIFREAEMDDAYRQADADLRLATRDCAPVERLAALERVRGLIFKAHDFVGLGKTADAVIELNQVIDMKIGLDGEESV